MQRLYKSRIYYLLGYNNRIARTPSLLLGIKLSISEDNKNNPFENIGGELRINNKKEDNNFDWDDKTKMIPGSRPEK